ncbi:MAG: hypothetical protein NXI12_04020 [Alphaproteobacteria bacterium]|nr:hypothetical protein [Alphaproteobacteria bacterium]
MKDRLIDTLLWTSRRLRFAVLALLAVAAVKTAAAALDTPPDPVPAGAQIRGADPVAPG